MLGWLWHGTGEENLRQIVSVVIAALAVTGCASSASLDERSAAVEVRTALPTPDQTAQAIDMSEYRIGPTDKIQVTVFGADELNRDGMVDAAGNFQMPLIGAIAAGGTTPMQLADKIADQLRGRYIKEPQVSVNVIEARAHSITVDGAVAQPGIYPVVGRMTLQQAIATARGTNDIADTDKVIVFRTIDGTKMAAMFDLDDIRAGRIEDPAIYGNDIIVVGESGTRRFLKETQQLGATVLSRFVPVY